MRTFKLYFEGSLHTQAFSVGIETLDIEFDVREPAGAILLLISEGVSE
jgi:hypothetical protein